MRSEEVLNTLSLRLEDIDPLEFARQLTLLEFEFYASLKPREFIDLAWMKDDKEEYAPGILAMARWSNKVILWIIHEIVSHVDIKKRIAIYERFVQIGYVCFSLWWFYIL
jgi:hypothetical protein